VPSPLGGRNFSNRIELPSSRGPAATYTQARQPSWIRPSRDPGQVELECYSWPGVYPAVLAVESVNSPGMRFWCFLPDGLKVGGNVGNPRSCRGMFQNGLDRNLFRAMYHSDLSLPETKYRVQVI
jgi:hypothetical protein